MPSLIASGDANGATIDYYLMGTINRNTALDWYEENEVIDAATKADLQSETDGYTLWFLNDNIIDNVYDADLNLNMVCLLSKDDCECAICAGLSGDATNSEVDVYALYFQGDEFLDFALGNTAEPDSTDISKQWIVQPADLSFDTAVTGAAGESYAIWRF